MKELTEQLQEKATKMYKGDNYDFVVKVEDAINYNNMAHDEGYVKGLKDSIEVIRNTFPDVCSAVRDKLENMIDKIGELI